MINSYWKYHSVLFLSALFGLTSFANATAYSHSGTNTLTVYVQNNLSQPFSCEPWLPPQGTWTDYLYKVPTGSTVTVGTGDGVISLNNSCTLGSGDKLILNPTLNGDLVQPNCATSSDSYVCVPSKQDNPSTIWYKISPSK